ncbi:mechanosensitive ion channel family protein [Gloeobacter morelensis]|uniref:Mechanosensitive ion channel n=1 Tax=Gloeobacter morelensis MG652769 TaxID=2781736 RepID=A0ABY3PIK2_9CYAN|nr:mechanosensitive ion channel domain-containing protein [Gloeobacter morelensis]UFP93510.1 mechanosensitive ion channel [Gloeobacter morelensis MG652769]
MHPGFRWIVSRLVAVLVLSAALICPLSAQETSKTESKSPTAQTAAGAVALDGKTLFVIEVELGSASASERGKNTTERLVKFAQNQDQPLDALRIESGDKQGIPLTAISYPGGNLATFSEADARAAGKSRTALAKDSLEKIRSAVGRYRQERQTGYLLRSGAYTAVATVILLAALRVINHVFARLYRVLKAWENVYIRPIHIGSYELLQANQLDDLITFFARLVQIAVVLGLLAIYFPLVLDLFPWTRQIAAAFRGYFLSAFQTIGLAIIGYIPNVFFIISVVTVAYLALRFLRPLSEQLERETFVLPGFYPEWAKPTYRLLTWLTIALAAVVIFPYLPGFDSPAFQGISVFLGILVSLGSTSAIANIVAGTLLIYTRNFKVGDIVRLGDTVGRVLETSLLVTRIITVKNVVINIPNSDILTRQIENFNTVRELDKKLILHTKVFLGYEVPWRRAYEALKAAAARTTFIAQEPQPFVLQKELNEVYVTYELNAYIDALVMAQSNAELTVERIYSQLHENIRDCCQEAGIRIFAPSYEADPNEFGPAAGKLN